MKALARVVLILGAVGVGFLLFRAAPREVTLVYGLPAGATARSLSVEIRRSGEVLRRAEIHVPAGAREVRHPVRLPDGDYLAVVRDGTGVFERPVTVSEAGTIVLPLGR
ncbi:MAG TPA: hypothetical protein VFR85_03175 [Anaeromyxobacteraceae bacterium]|nr:hypothetical protein [Anaeromyxobacteraceae bacterium]